MNLDDLDIAYIAHGAFTVLRSLSQKEHLAVTQEFNGELGFIHAVLLHKKFLQRAIANVENCNTVFAYDIAEPFGHAIGAWLAKTGNCLCAADIAEDLVREACE